MSEQILSRWGVIGVNGDDAITFLHSQLSNDIVNLSINQLCLAGLCTAKGRLLGVFFVLRHENQVFLLCRKEIIPTLVKRMSMFVLRSKCSVRDCSTEFLLTFLPSSISNHPMQVTWDDEGNAMASLRALNGQLPCLKMTKNKHTEMPVHGDDLFEFTLQQLGIAYVTNPTVEMFIPQAINLDLVGGISFTKGCYPGQEVVARNHYLGKIKRRVFQASTTNKFLVCPGQDVWLSGKINEPAGLVVTSIEFNHQQFLLLELMVDDVEQPNALFRVNTKMGEVQLDVKAPPYDVRQKGNLFEST
jgi:folate-binding protein YgfZ